MRGIIVKGPPVCRVCMKMLDTRGHERAERMREKECGEAERRRERKCVRVGVRERDRYR